MFVWVAASSWRIEECFQFGKSHLGLADYEVPSWTGWHRHTALVMAAGAFLSVLRFQLEGLPEATNNPLFLMTKKAGSLDAFKRTRVRPQVAHRELSVAGAWTLIRLSLAELRRWIWRILFPHSWSIESLLNWSFWRRKHQASARFLHYRKQGQIT